MSATRCSKCADRVCNCTIRKRPGSSVTITGSGTPLNPYEVDAGFNLIGLDTPTIDVEVSAGSGSASDPKIIQAQLIAGFSDLKDVGPISPGQVVAKRSDGTFYGVAPATADVGSITSDTSIAGDGSAGDPLGVRLAPGSGLEVTPDGLMISGAGAYQTYNPVIKTNNIQPTWVNGTRYGRYIRFGKMVHVSIQITIGSADNLGSGRWEISLPVVPRFPVETTAYGRIDFGNTATSVYGSIQSAATGIARIYKMSNDSAIESFTFKSGDRLILQATYESSI